MESLVRHLRSVLAYLSCVLMLAIRAASAKVQGILTAGLGVDLSFSIVVDSCGSKGFLREVVIRW